MADARGAIGLLTEENGHQPGATEDPRGDNDGALFDSIPKPALVSVGAEDGVAPITALVADGTANGGPEAEQLASADGPDTPDLLAPHNPPNGQHATIYYDANGNGDIIASDEDATDGIDHAPGQLDGSCELAREGDAADEGEEPVAAAQLCEGLPAWQQAERLERPPALRPDASEPQLQPLSRRQQRRQHRRAGAAHCCEEPPLQPPPGFQPLLLPPPMPYPFDLQRALQGPPIFFGPYMGAMEFQMAQQQQFAAQQIAAQQQFAAQQQAAAQQHTEFQQFRERVARDVRAVVYGDRSAALLYISPWMQEAAVTAGITLALQTDEHGRLLWSMPQVIQALRSGPCRGHLSGPNSVHSRFDELLRGIMRGPHGLPAGTAPAAARRPGGGF